MFSNEEQRDRQTERETMPKILHTPLMWGVMMLSVKSINQVLWKFSISEDTCPVRPQECSEKLSGPHYCDKSCSCVCHVGYWQSSDFECIKGMILQLNRELCVRLLWNRLKPHTRKSSNNIMLERLDFLNSNSIFCLRRVAYPLASSDLIHKWPS